VTQLSTSPGRGRLLLAATAMGAALSGACAKTDMGADPGPQDAASDGVPWPEDLVSDFEDATAAIVLRLGWPPRNGSWYTYNDASSKCTQEPTAAAAGTKPATYVGATPPSPSPGPSGGRALHAQWKSCSTWGAGIGADFNAAMIFDGTVYTGPKVAYDMHSWPGVTFWAMAAASTDVNRRVQMPMTSTLAIADGGSCDEAEAGAGRCGDHWGQTVTISAGSWKRVDVRFADPGFKQKGTGAAIPWDPTEVTGVQIQSADPNQTYDFWIDDVYLVR